MLRRLEITVHDARVLTLNRDRQGAATHKQAAGRSLTLAVLGRAASFARFYVALGNEARRADP